MTANGSGNVVCMRGFGAAGTLTADVCSSTIVNVDIEIKA